MKKSLRISALILALLLIVGCAAAAETVQDEMILATVNGAPVSIEDAYAEYSAYADFYEAYGLSDSAIESLREQIAEYYIQLHLIYSKIAELKLDEQIDEAFVQEEADRLFEETLSLYMDYYADESCMEEENRDKCIEQMAADGYSREDAYEDARNNLCVQALVNFCSEGVSVTDEEVRSHYDETLASQIESYGKYVSNFESDWSSGDAIYYIPEGIRFVKHILVSLPDSDQSTLYNLNLELSNIESSLSEEDADVETLNARKEEIEAEIEAIYETIMPRVEEIQSRINAGEDFLELMAEYGEDPGMQEGSSYYESGYMVWEGCSSWVAPFTEGSMSLAAAGDVTGPVRTTYGIHLIRYESELESRTVPFEEVQETIYADLLDARINEAFMTSLTDWQEAAEIVSYADNLETMRQAARSEAEADAE